MKKIKFGKLVLVRHGQSIWNLQNRFTGWVDVSLSRQGIDEAKHAAQILKDYKFDIAFTSEQIRAQQTLFEILNLNNFSNEYFRVHENQSIWYSNISKRKDDDKTICVFVSDKLNERYYGDLQGLNKEETAKKYGETKVHLWRRSFDVPPPNGESLEMTSKRTIPYFIERIEKELKLGKNVLVAAHGNSLRSIVMYIEKMSSEQILNFEMKTGVPHIYEFDSKFKVKGRGILGLE